MAQGAGRRTNAFFLAPDAWCLVPISDFC